MPNRRKFLALGGTALALGGLWWGAARTTGGGLSAPGQTLLPGAAQAQEATAPAAPDATLPTVPDYALGNPDAAVTVIEYASFTCPHCREFHDAVWPQLKKNYVDTGKIKFVMREVYFDRYGLWAGMVARCGGELRYYGIVDILFNTQKDWAASNDPEPGGREPAQDRAEGGADQGSARPMPERRQDGAGDGGQVPEGRRRRQGRRARRPSSSTASSTPTWATTNSRRSSTAF